MPSSSAARGRAPAGRAGRRATSSSAATPSPASAHLVALQAQRALQRPGRCPGRPRRRARARAGRSLHRGPNGTRDGSGTDKCVVRPSGDVDAGSGAAPRASNEPARPVPTPPTARSAECRARRPGQPRPQPHAASRAPVARAGSAGPRAAPLDLIGLGLVALARLPRLPVYLGWDGGTAGSALVDGLGARRRRCTYSRPSRSLAAGACSCCARSCPRCGRSAPGALCLFAALRSASRRARSGSGRAARAGRREDARRRCWARGCTGLLDAARRRRRPHRRGLPLPRRRPAAHGRVVAGVLKATGDSVTTTGRRVRERAEPVRTAVATRSAPRARSSPSSRRSEFTAVAGAHGRERAPGKEDFWSGAERFPDLYDGSTAAEPEPSPSRELERTASRAATGARRRRDRGRARGSPRTPRRTSRASRAPARSRGRPGRAHARRAATAARSPTRPTSSGRSPTRASSSARPPSSRPDTAGQEKTAAQLVEALGHFGVEAQVIGMVAGPAHHPLRAAPRARHQGRQGRPAQGRPRLRAGRHRHPHPRADPGQAGRRRRGPQRAPPDRPPRRRPPGAARGLVAADGLARQGRRGPRDRRRPGEDAAPARRGHDRRRQVRLRQRDARLDPAARHAARGAARARRPQAGRAQPLRVDPAPAHAGHHEPAQAANALQNLVREMEQRYAYMSLARTRSLIELNKVRASARRAGAAVHPVRDRRARRPDDGRARRRRGLDHPPRPEGARGRHPPRARHAVARASTSSRA